METCTRWMKEQGAAPTENCETSEWESFLYGQKKKKKKNCISQQGL